MLGYRILGEYFVNAVRMNKLSFSNARVMPNLSLHYERRLPSSLYSCPIMIRLIRNRLLACLPRTSGITDLARLLQVSTVRYVLWFWRLGRVWNSISQQRAWHPPQARYLLLLPRPLPNHHRHHRPWIHCLSPTFASAVPCLRVDYFANGLVRRKSAL